MNDLDGAIVATLRAQAREAEMGTDTPQQYQELSSRLDDVDRSRTRTRWAALAAVAVVVAALGGWFVGGGALPGSRQVVPAASAPAASAAPADDAAVEALARHWTTSVTAADVRAALAGTPFESDAQDITDGMFEYHGGNIGTLAAEPWTLDLYMQGRDATLYVTAADGSQGKVDGFRWSLDSEGALTTRTPYEDNSSVETAVYRVSIVDGKLRLAWLSGSSTGGAPADANEGPKRALYTSTVWSPAY